MISCNPASLVQSAKCFSCIPRQARRWVRNYLLCQIANKAAAPSGPFTLFTTPLVQQGSGVTVIPHGLGQVPLIRAVMVCTAADANLGAAVGLEYPLEQWLWSTNSSLPVSGVVADATNITVTSGQFANGNEGTIQIWMRGPGGDTLSPSSCAHFALKVYAFKPNVSGFTRDFAVDSGNLSVPHGLAGKPNLCFGRIVALVNDPVTGLNAGDEMPISNMDYFDGGPVGRAVFDFGTNATSLFFFQDGLVSGGPSWTCWRKNANAGVNATSTNYKGRVTCFAL